MSPFSAQETLRSLNTPTAEEKIDGMPRSFTTADSSMAYSIPQLSGWGVPQETCFSPYGQAQSSNTSPLLASDDSGAYTVGAYTSGASLERTTKLDHKKGSKVSVACQVCKQKKIKCTGTVPCEPCVKGGLALSCDINEGLDSRRKSTRKRDVEDRKRLDGLAEKTFIFLKRNPDEDIVQLRDIARTGTRNEVEEFIIRVALDTPLDDLSPESPGTRRERKRSRSETELPRRTAAAVAWMCHEPVVSVPATPWVTIVDDQLLVSHLVSLWSAWCFPVWQWFDLEIFLAAMRSERLDSPHCSPFLVHCILAEACYFAGDIRSYLAHSDSRRMSKLFHRQAEKLLDQDSKPCLASIQGLAVLVVFCIQTGNDRKGRLLAAQMFQMAQDLKLGSAAPIDQDETGYAENLTAWALFSLQGILSQTMQAPQIHAFPQPRTALRESGGCDAPEWRHYPQRADVSRKAHFGCLRKSSALLACFSGAVSEALFAKTQRLSESQAMNTAKALREQIHAWRQGWSACLQNQEGALPHILLLHMQYWYYQSSISAILHERVAQNTVMSTLAVTLKSEAREAAMHVAQLVDDYAKSWTLMTVHVLLAQICQVTAIILLRMGLHDSASQSAFETLCEAVKAFSTYWELGVGMQLQISGVEVPRLGLETLPEATKQYVAEMHNHAEAVCKGSSIVFNSSYPSFAAALVAEDPSHVALDRMMEQCRNLTIKAQTTT